MVPTFKLCLNMSPLFEYVAKEVLAVNQDKDFLESVFSHKKRCPFVNINFFTNKGMFCSLFLFS